MLQHRYRIKIIIGNQAVEPSKIVALTLQLKIFCRRYLQLFTKAFVELKRFFNRQHQKYISLVLPF